jgi:hypothetical protein
MVSKREEGSQLILVYLVRNLKIYVNVQLEEKQERLQGKDQDLTTILSTHQVQLWVTVSLNALRQMIMIIYHNIVVDMVIVLTLIIIPTQVLQNAFVILDTLTMCLLILNGTLHKIHVFLIARMADMWI